MEARRSGCSIAICTAGRPQPPSPTAMACQGGPPLRECTNRTPADARTGPLRRRNSRVLATRAAGGHSRLRLRLWRAKGGRPYEGTNRTPAALELACPRNPRRGRPQPPSPTAMACHRGPPLRMHEPDPCGAGTRVSSQPATRAATAAFAYGYGVPRGAVPTNARTDIPGTLSATRQLELLPVERLARAGTVGCAGANLNPGPGARPATRDSRGNQDNRDSRRTSCADDS
jgi:hypothetical protein